MKSGLFFFCCACCILFLTIINISVGPITSGTLKRNFGNSDVGTWNCAIYKDLYDMAKDSGKSGDALKYGEKWDLDDCRRCKGMHDMEYTSFIFDIVIGFVCSLVGLLHLFDVKKDLVSKTGLIGIGCGIVGFALTFTYVILNGIVYTTTDTGIPKRNGDYAYAEKNGDNFKCLFFDKQYNTHSIYATVSDLIKKQYNYVKDWDKDLDQLCVTNAHVDDCSSRETIPIQTFDVYKDCKYLYTNDYGDEIINKDLSDRFLTTLILSLFVCIANIGLALFGFLLFKTPGDF